MTAVAEGTVVNGIDPADAVQILPPNPDRAEWLMMRRTGIGGSDVSALVGLSAYTSRWSLWEDKTGRAELDQEPSEAAEMGLLLEPVVRDRFARLQRVTVAPAGMLRSQRWPWMLANPDGLILDDRHGYEGKTCSAYQLHEWGSADDPLIPDHAELQAQWCMAVTGWTGWWVAVLIGGQHNRYRFVHRDDRLIEHLVQVSHDFWTRNVLADVEPEVDGSEALARELKARNKVSAPESEVQIRGDEFDLLRLLHGKATQALGDATADVEAVKNRVRKHLGDREQLRCGDQTLATWKTTRKFAAAQFRKAHPELWAQYQRPATAFDAESFEKDNPALFREFCSRVLNFND